MDKKGKKLIIWSIWGGLGLLIFVLFYNKAFPSASIRLNVNRKKAIEIAETFIKAQGFDLSEFDRTVIFESDYYASIYLQKTQGMEKLNQLVREGIPIWFWQVRWFKDLEKEGFLVHISPSNGEIVFYKHSILDNDIGANLTKAEAMEIAKSKIYSQGIDLDDYDLKDSSEEKQKNRMDHYFNWEKKDYKLEEATLRINVSIFGDKIGRYGRYLKIPEIFSRYLKKEFSFGGMLSMGTTLIKFLLTILAIFILVFKNQKMNVNTRFWLICGCIIVFLKLMNFFNNIPLLWTFYYDTMSKPVFFISSFMSQIKEAVSSGLMVFAYGSLGELYYKKFVKDKMPLYNAFINRNFLGSNIISTFVVGYSLGFLFLGYITLFYIIGTKFFHIWMPPNTEYTNILGTTLPFLYPLTGALIAAVDEEFIYRFFSVAFLKEVFKPIWVCLLMPALIWGFAHSTYHIFPTYVRGIELTVLGIVLAIVFLKYGLGTVIIGHFVANVTLMVLPLLKSNNLYYFISGLLVIMITILPIGLIIYVRKNAKKCTGPISPISEL